MLLPERRNSSSPAIRHRQAASWKDSVQKPAGRAVCPIKALAKHPEAHAMAAFDAVIVAHPFIFIGFFFAAPPFRRDAFGTVGANDAMDGFAPAKQDRRRVGEHGGDI